MTVISWQTLFSKIASDLDNLPICKGNASNSADFGFEIITPNRLKLGRNNFRALDDSFILYSNTEVQFLEAYRIVQSVWYQILIDRLHYLIPKPKKWMKTDPVSIGDVVVFVLKDAGVLKRTTWSTGRVIKPAPAQVRIQYFWPWQEAHVEHYKVPQTSVSDSCCG